MNFIFYLNNFRQSISESIENSNLNTDTLYDDIVQDGDDSALIGPQPSPPTQRQVPPLQPAQKPSGGPQRTGGQASSGPIQHRPFPGGQRPPPVKGDGQQHNHVPFSQEGYDDFEDGDLAIAEMLQKPFEVNINTKKQQFESVFCMLYQTLFE